MQYRVFSLDERIAVRGPGPGERQADRSRAVERLRYLRKRYFSGRARPFNRWLSLISTASGGELHDLIEMEGAIEFAGLPSEGWSDYLTAAMKRSEGAGSQAGSASNAIAAAAAPFVLEATDRARAALRSVTRITLEEDAILKAFSWNLSAKLSRILAPSITVLANIYRINNADSDVGGLCDMLADPARRAGLLQGMPLLDRILAETAMRATDAFVELVGRLDADAAQLSHLLSLGDTHVTSIQVGLGDPHQGGRSVAVIHIGGARVVYKPRSMATDVAFNATLDWLQSRIHLELRGVRTLDRGSYGWAGFIQHSSCSTLSEVRDCYRRIGAILALLYVLGGSDVHFENIICDGAHPYLIDLETLFSPTMRLRDLAQRLRTRVQTNSVLRIGSLPHASDFGGGVMDISAAGMHASQEGPAYVAYSAVSDLEAVGVASKVRLEPLGNSPKLAGEIQPAFRFQAEIRGGFRLAAEALLADRESPELARVLGAMRDLPFRWVARPTKTYAQTLMASFQPDLMRDYVDRDFAFAQLMPGALFADGRGEAMLRAEVADLRVGDIPIFHACSGSRDLEDSAGVRIEGVFEKTGYETMVERLRKLSRAEIARQEHLITLAFDSVETMSSQRLDLPATAATGARNDPLGLARRMADHIANAAVVTAGVPHWFGVEPITTERGAVRILPNSLYHGAAGIGIFAADLARMTGEERYERLARRCLRAVRLTSATERRKPGAFDGEAGFIYAELRICRDSDQRRYPQLRRRLQQVGKVILRDWRYDIISGAAGVLLVALEAAQDERLADVAMATAKAASRRLIDQASWSPEGACWRIGGATHGLTGFSHGTSGIAYALARYHAISGDGEAVAAVHGALDYEMSQLDTTVGNWPDLRESSHKDGASSGLSWCHGAPGVAFGRQLIKSLGVIDAARLDDGLQIGLAAVRSRPPLNGACLCHGNLGNAQCVESIGEDGRQLANDLVEAAFARAADLGAWFGDLRYPQPGLMTGYAGIGHSLLRLVDPQLQGVLSLGGAAPLR